MEPQPERMFPHYASRAIAI